MTGLAILIPVKSSDIKSRLTSVLSEPQRRELARLFLLDVLGAVRGAGLLKACHVVSADDMTLNLADRMGAGAIRESGDSGVNAGVALGISRAKGADDILVVPSDLPLLRPTDIVRLLALRAAGLDVVVTPSLAFDGTNALAFSRSSHLPLSYDDDSFWNHLAAAGRKGLSVGVYSARTVMFDVDTPRDLRLLAQATARSRSAAFARRTLT